MRISPSDVVILPVRPPCCFALSGGIDACEKLLFTTGMTLVDSLDSILMIYSYTGFTSHSWRIFEPSGFPLRTGDARSVNMNGKGESAVEVCPAMTNEAVASASKPRDTIEIESKTVDNARHDNDSDAAGREEKDRIMLIKRSTMSELSIVLTTISILLAFRSVNGGAIRWLMTRLILPSISLIEIMGLIATNCDICQAAASASDGGGLAGRWWRGWVQVSGQRFVGMILKQPRRTKVLGTLEQG